MRIKKFIPIICILLLTFSLNVYSDNFIELGRGWNLLQLHDDNIDLVDDYPDTYLVAYWFDPIEKKYYQIAPRNEFDDHFRTYPEETKQKLLNTAMWVYSTKTEQRGIETGALIPFEKAGLWRGWNLMPITPEMADMKISKLTEYCDVEKIYFYNVQQGWFQVFINDRDEFESRQSGLGFAIKVRDDCTFSQSAEQIGAPPTVPE